ncbi:Uncharacterized protein HZ326_10255 [Fusarium oxysporum f. sp. albedinis]|nr:Uncharacterized protein HZ326_10255 [Fusarium oxysporum f. sp. albedinis]
MKHDVTAEDRYQELGSNPLFFQSSIDPNDRLCHFLEDFITVLPLKRHSMAWLTETLNRGTGTGSVRDHRKIDSESAMYALRRRKPP